jgi:predicted nucleotidyltransferase
MTKQQRATLRYVQPYRYPSPNIPLSAIKRFARQIAERFQPEKIVLFGSYAYGKPHNESDVDLLVIMPTSNPIAQSVRIDLAFERPFSLDVIVRTPKQIERRLREDDPDWFIKEVMRRERYCMKRHTGQWLFKAKEEGRGLPECCPTAYDQPAWPGSEPLSLGH